MNNAIKNLFIFVSGAAIGSIVTWQFVKTKYEQLAQEEIDSVKETFSKREEARTKADEAKEKPNLMEYASKLQENGYSKYSNVGKEEDKNAMDKPYVISPDEFGEFEDYDTISLRYYADHVLTDEEDELVEDVDDVVGLDSLNRFGEYEEDSVFVRNDRLKADYEILLDLGNYADITQRKPR